MTDFLNTAIPNQTILFPALIKIPICFQIRVKPQRGLNHRDSLKTMHLTCFTIGVQMLIEFWRQLNRVIDTKI